MADAIRVEGAVNGAGKTMSFETGRLAPLADGAVVVQLGDTTLLSTVVTSKPREGIDFFPLTVDVEERMYAAGKIPGSFFRREGRATDQAILTCRLIDRPLRPSFPDGFRNEVHVVATVLGADQENPHDVLAINGASAALMLSGIPFEGPIGAVRMGFTTDGTWVPHPTYQEGDLSTFELVVAGRALDDGDVAIMMVEAGGTEDAWSFYEGGASKVTEEVIADGLEVCKTWIREAIELQSQLVDQAGVRPALHWESQLDHGDDVASRVAELGRDRLAEVNRIADKTDRNAAADAAEADIFLVGCCRSFTRAPTLGIEAAGTTKTWP